VRRVTETHQHVSGSMTAIRVHQCSSVVKTILLRADKTAATSWEPRINTDEHRSEVNSLGRTEPTIDTDQEWLVTGAAVKERGSPRPPSAFISFIRVHRCSSVVNIRARSYDSGCRFAGAAGKNPGDANARP